MPDACSWQPTKTLYGVRAVLVLSDERGEYEVARALKIAEGVEVISGVIIDMSRVADAIDRRADDDKRNRPVY